MSSSAAEQFVAKVRDVACGPAAANADAVDRAARFPSEAIDALRDAGALSAYVPTSLGGTGVTIRALAAACRELGRGCAATAMVFAMHQIQVASVVRHLGESAWFTDYLRRLSAEQRLIASATSEVGTGGDLTRSVAGIEAVGDGCSRFEKQATTVSYGLHADDLLTTVRRSSSADCADQVLVLTNARQTQFEQTSNWDTLGMRGTCSPGFVVRATFAAEQVLATPFAVIAAETMVPVSHLLWSELWLGIATDAFERARAWMRERARSSGGVPEGAERLSAVMTELSLLRAEVDSALADFERYDSTPGRPQLSTLAAALRFNNLKVAASDKAAQITLAALASIGVAGYKNDTPFSVGRHVRDALSAPLMVSNSRIHAINGSLLMIAKDV